MSGQRPPIQRSQRPNGPTGRNWRNWRNRRAIAVTANFALQLVIGALIVAAFDLRYLLVYLPYILGQRLSQPWPPMWPLLALPIGVTLAWRILATVALSVSILHRHTARETAGDMASS